jgi:arginine:pyruvate transaminase
MEPGMRYAAITERLAHLGGAKWDIHSRARRMQAEGRDVIELTIGEPDVPTPGALVEVAAAAMRTGRTGYSNGRGEAALLCALSRRYSLRSGRTIGADQILCLPGTQTSLYAVLNALLQTGDEVLLGDPMYATYEGLIASTGAAMVPVPLRPEAGFRMQAADVADRLTPRSRVLFLNSPHNPTGALLRAADLAALGDLAIRHDLWIVCDEVYEELVYAGAAFLSPLSDARLADRVVVVSSISKSHAAPGFRSGWCVGPADFAAHVLPLAETMLFGNQPFIADMTAAAVAAPSPVAAGMAARFAARADLVRRRLDGVAGLAVSRPEAGMFVLIDVRATGKSGQDFALDLLDRAGVAVMPGESFGQVLAGWVRVSLTQPDAVLETACARIAAQVGARPARAIA